MCENHRNIPVREMEPPPLSAPLVSPQRIAGATETVAAPSRVVADHRNRVVSTIVKPTTPAHQEVRTPVIPAQPAPVRQEARAQERPVPTAPVRQEVRTPTPARQETRMPEKPAVSKAPIQTPRTEPKAVAQPIASATEQKPAVIEDDGDKLARELRQIAEQNRRKGGGHHKRRR